VTNNYKNAKFVVKTLLDAGYQAFFVGGFVRDFLLNRIASDIDITTDATPREVEQLFKKTKATGKKFGTVTVFYNQHQYEVTTFRTEGKYIHHRKPSEVSFSKELEEDLTRRDFTINAFAMNLEEEITDLFHGEADLNHKLIRSIGNPDVRFHEDALRILRAFRFVSKLGFDIEEQTFESLKNNMSLLKEIPIERVMVEMKKTFQNPFYLDALRLMKQANIEVAFPELKEGIDLICESESITLNYLEFYSLCFYMHNQEIPDYWRFSNKERTKISKIMELVSVTDNDVYNEMIIYSLGREIPLMANRVSTIINPNNNQESLIQKIYQELPIHKTCDLVFKGQDVLELTELKNAEIIGEIIDDITYQVITKQLPNDYQKLKAYTLHLLETKYE